MTAKDVLGAANRVGIRERAVRFERVCSPRGTCRQEPLANDPGRWTWCADCLTLYDDYGQAVNRILITGAPAPAH